MPNKPSWEEKFNKKFCKMDKLYVVDLDYKDIKLFIRQTIKEERAKSYQEGYDDARDDEASKYPSY